MFDILIALGVIVLFFILWPLLVNIRAACMTATVIAPVVLLYGLYTHDVRVVVLAGAIGGGIALLDDKFNVLGSTPETPDNRNV